jgi:hypothetical protein
VEPIPVRKSLTVASGRSVITVESQGSKQATVAVRVDGVAPPATALWSGASSSTSTAVAPMP